MSEYKFDPILEGLFIGHGHCATKKEEACVRIRINGKYATLLSKKSAWKTVGHAKNALRAHFGYHLRNVDDVPYDKNRYKSSSLSGILNEIFDNGNVYSRKDNEIWNAFIKHLQDKGILEFIKV